MGNLLADLFSIETRPTIVEMLLTAGIPIAVGIAAFSFALRAQDNGASKSLKWYALIPFAIGAILCWKYLHAVTGDPAYMMSNWPGWPREGRREVVLHWAAFLLPIAAGITCAIWGVIHTRNQDEQF